MKCKHCGEEYKIRGSSHIGAFIKMLGFCTNFCKIKYGDTTDIFSNTNWLTEKYFVINKDS